MTLRTYLAKRIGIAIFILWVVATLNFLIFVWYPGDPAMYILNPRVTEDVKRMMLERYGLLDPLHIQYLKYLRNMFTFGVVEPYFGVSFTTNRFVAADMSWRLGYTLLLLGSVLIGRILMGIPLGVLAASRRGGKKDVLVIGSGLFTWGVPTFFIQLLAIFFFTSFLSFQYGITIFPRGGAYSVPKPEDPLALLVDIAWHFSLPILTLVLAGFGSWALYIRNMMIDALTQDYVVTARAKGLKERAVLYKHVFKSILPPVATLVTLAIPGIVTGAIITETIFGIPGIGKWYLDSLSPGTSDFPVIQAVLFIFALLVILCNLIADILYGLLDPRIRVGERR